jgi:putative redox protein
MTSKRITFPGHNGQNLAARLDLPDPGPQHAARAYALFAHCFTCGKDIPAARRIAQRLTAAGIGVLRFDFTGLGHSEGEFANTTFTSNVEDLERAAQWMADQGMAPSLIIGHSLGGAASLIATRKIPTIKAAAILGTPYNPAHVTRHFQNKTKEIETKGQAEIKLGERSVHIGRGFLKDIGQTELSQAITNLNAALLVLHAPRDEIVSIDNAAEIFQQAKHPKSFVSLDQADHLITDAKDAEYAAGVIAAWAAHYIPLKPPAPPPGAPEGVTRVSESSPAGFLQDISIGGQHHLLADEPQAYGGTNRGPSPYGLLAAGLGACTSMTLRMYARRKGWPLTHVEVDVTHDKVHAQDANTGGTTERADRFSRVIRLTGPLDQSQKARLLEIADKCPVHRTLEHSSQIETRLG